MMNQSIILIAALLSATLAVGAEKPISVDQLPQRIDGFLKKHWTENKVQPARRADDATILRRLTLDLLGRIPTREEREKFLADKSPEKRRRLVDRLLAGPEFPLHMGNVLDQMIQNHYAGNEAFVDYLRRSIRDSKSWDVIFRDLMLGPWDSETTKPANRFLDKRAKTSDVLAVDTARVFFGVDISCAKCHDHPLVDDWKQEHFYGMVAFFNRTTGGKGKIGEKKDGEVTFLGKDGKEKVAQVMFLSGKVIKEPVPSKKQTKKKDKRSYSRRKQLVRVAMEQREFFSRALVNRMWEYFFGRGLIHPVDQMHSGNESAIPELLDWMASDFAANGYDLRRLIRSIVNSQAYGLSSRWERDTPVPTPDMFAAARLRPLSRQQLAFAVVQATGNADLREPTEVESRAERYTGAAGVNRVVQYLRLEKRAARLVKAFDNRRVDFHSSVGEALFLSNNAAIQELLTSESNLAEELSVIKDDKQLITLAVSSILNREPSADELSRFTSWLARQNHDRRRACEQLVWALVASAEFRFNH